jgi:predicted ribosomally synthesized peptide with SipW-like signal peptide
MKKLLFSFIVLGITSILAIGATSAFFSDTEISAGNTFTTGTLDLGVANIPGTNPTGGTSATWTMSNMKPGDQQGAIIYLHNSGSIDANKVFVKFEYTTDHNPPSTVDPGTSTLDTALKLKTNQEMPGYHPVRWNGTYRASVALSDLPTDWVRLGHWGGTADPDLGYRPWRITAGGEVQLRFVWELDQNSDNGVQNSSADVTVHFMIEQ